MKKRPSPSPRRPRAAAPARARAPRRRKEVEDFRTLSFRILHLATRGLHTLDFLLEVSRTLLDFSGCEHLELWCKAGGRCQRLSCSPSRLLGYRCKPCQEGDPIRRTCGEALEELGAIVRDRARGSCLLELDLAPSFHEPASGARASRGSVAVLPFLVDDHERGLLILRSSLAGRFAPRDIDLYRSISQRLGIAIASQRAQAALKERVKELTCLHSVTRLLEQPGISLDEVLQGIADLLPSAWQFPEGASARVRVEGRAFPSSGFEERGQVLVAPILVHGEELGDLEVRYRDEMPVHDEGPFLLEERHLIDSIARQIALVLERRKESEERRRLEEQLRHADRLATIGTLAAGVAHELNEPLGSILGFAELAQESEGVPGPVRDDLSKIVAAALHAREVVKKLMIFSRPTRPRGVPVDLNLLVQEGLVFLESRCAQGRIEVVRDLAPGLPMVTADPSQLQQVLVNLAVNAIQAMPDGGSLTLRTVAEEAWVSLVVEDTGLGMTEEVMSRAFLPFFTTKEVGQGTGLGLAVVHGIVASHGGLVTIESKVGAGSRFEVMLPLGAPLSVPAGSAHAV
jgi:signal transduction histidine kinase